MKIFNLLKSYSLHTGLYVTKLRTMEANGSTFLVKIRVWHACMLYYLDEIRQLFCQPFYILSFIHPKLFIPSPINTKGKLITMSSQNRHFLTNLANSQNDNHFHSKWSILSENSCHFLNLLSYFLFSQEPTAWTNVDHLNHVSSYFKFVGWKSFLNILEVSRIII